MDLTMSDSENEVTESRESSEAQSGSDDFLVRRRLRDGATKARYQELVIGRPGFLSLILYETIVTLTSWVPGALGLVLRRYLYPVLLGSVGKKPVSPPIAAAMGGSVSGSHRFDESSPSVENR